MEHTQMRPSQLQLLDLVYLNIKITSRQLIEGENAALPFDFDGVQITEGADFSILDDDKDDPRQFALKFRIALENKIGKAAPYDVDIEVAGVFSIISDMPAADREDFVRVNGCAVLYGAIRDQVLTLTSRSARGALMLPTVNFLDYRRNVKELVAK
jgi:hypothetical protein